jgi:tight adherence protein B
VSAPSLTALKVAALVLVLVGVCLFVRDAASGDTFLARYYRRYVAYLDRSLRLLFLSGSGRRVVLGQLAALVAAGAAGAALGVEYFACLLPLVLLAPRLYLARKRAQHLKKLESQLDSLILSLANALKTVPSPAAALTQIVPVLPSPVSLELDRALKEVRVGSTLEQAILNMSARLRSNELDTALSALLIGLQVGGNLPRVLENTALTVREMGRLEGVVRTKTSEARAQLWVLALFPFAICIAFSALDPTYFDPLRQSSTGTAVTAVALCFWSASIFLARRIVRVDL